MYIYTDFSEDRLVAVTNADLPHTVGNLLQRVSTPRLNPGGPRLKFSLDMFPIGGQSVNCRASAEDYELITNLQNLPGKQTCLLLFTCLQMCFLICVEVVKVHYDAFEFGKGLSAIMKCLTQVSFIKLTLRKKSTPFFFQTNVFIDCHTPWKLVPIPDQHEWLQTILSVVVEVLRLCSILLHPVIPTSACDALQRIGFEQDLNLKSDAVLQCLLTSEEGVKRFNATNLLSFGTPPLFSKLSYY